MEKLLSQAGNSLEKQVAAAADVWETRLRKAGLESDAHMRRASWLAWVGAAVIAICACVIVGSYLGNYVFSLVHHDGDGIHLTRRDVASHHTKKERVRK